MPGKDFDILVSGGGIAGLTAAAAFGQAGFSVLVVDPTPPVTDRDAEGADLRSTAFLQPARDFLDQIGLWGHLAPQAMPLQTMRIVDAGGPDPEPRVSHDFQSDDISDRPFGWNLPNWLLRREIAAHLGEMANVDYRTGAGTTSLFTREAEARVTLTDGTRPRVRLVVAADGRNSPMRQAAGIDVKTTRFGQKALAFAVTHDLPHHNVSTEVHRTGGPFTFVPLPDHEGRPCSAIVWMEEGPKAEALAKLDTAAFEAEMTRRSCGLFGPLTLASRRTIWPIIAQEAEHLSAQRLALVAEAAHVVPPIGAQGLNMSLKDIAKLTELASASPGTLGDRAMLDTYHRSRIADVRARVAGIAALNRISMLSAPRLRDLRASGLDALYGMKPVRTAMMQLGLGARG
ncbi:UbiH/UbiF family hydroxylase [Allosediminivita pacifica]|uniref:2-octaprenyl-6-methoxyphenol hydroxylase n=1 Tax=Allosediminivita pacifica TaxID=1267769 RepID=A0A2T6AQK2_9RHOB|nr:UbiH/UbiF family hydroxylase [Allosediminivita pacifica]PTX46036.1 2-octaprenyl-6-methoxyphenol hydroxylase [Allosediminivita pacifica]GGB18826.1 2-octaprenyl-6-methoxyphenyl hydroxylase [Allosediminivita pacifica]